MKKGFTLIELLAVIVILAIIALIATPIVLNIINDSKESSLLRSAEMYIKSAELSIAQSTLKNKNITDGTYNLKDGDICLNTGCTDKLEVEVSGKVPDSGTITMLNGSISELSLVLDGKTIVKNSEGKFVFEETPAFEKGKFSSVCKPVDGTEYNLAAGTEYKCKVKEVMEEKYSDGYTFYVLNTRNKAGEIITESSTDKEAVSINLIMAQNINSDGTPTTKAIYEYDKDNNGGIYNLVAYNSSGDAADVGPVTVMSFLNNATSTWDNIDNLNITYDDEGENFTDFALNGKARLPYHSEVNNVGCLDFEDLSCPVWMVDYLNDAGPDYETTYQENPIADIYGYWTLSSDADDPGSAWLVYYLGGVLYDSVGLDGDYGARPVINLKI